MMKRNLIIITLAIIALLLPLYAHAGYVGDNISISVSSYDQQNPDVIYLPDKEVYFVVWEDWSNANTGADIKGRFIKGDGTFCGDEEFTITDADGNQTAPSAAYRNGDIFSPPGTSRILVAWQDTRGDATGGYVYYTDIDVSGLDPDCSPGTYTFGAETPVGYNGIKEWEPSIASLDTGYAEENIGTGDGVTTNFTGTLSHTPIVPNSVEITDGTQVVTDDGSGNLTGDGTGTIDYSTGDVDVTFNNPPVPGDDIKASYSYGDAIGTGNGTDKTFSGFLSHTMIIPGSVVVTDGTQIVVDDGAGSLTGDGSGSIDYGTGFITVTFDSAPTSGDPIVVSYSYYSSMDQVDIGDELRSRQRPKVSYDPVRDRFWIVWTESRDILNRISELCFGFAPVSWSFGDRSFPGYLMLEGDTLAPIANDLGVTGPDIIRDGLTRTNRLISHTNTGLVDEYTYEFFTDINNITVSSDTISPSTLMVWEGKRQKGVLTCTCDDSNNNNVCDSGEVVTSTFATSNYDDGLTHIYGLFDGDIYVSVVNSTWIDGSNPLPGYYPSAGFDPITDRFLVAWEDMRDGPNTKIYGQILYSGGGLYNDNFIISYQDTNDDGQQDDNVAGSKQTRPFVSYDNAEQRFFVVWQDGRNSTLSLENLDIYGQKVDSEGSLRGDNYAVFTLPSNQYHPAIAYDDNLQQFLAVWKDARDADASTCGTHSNEPCGSDVYGQLFSLQQPSITLLRMDDTPLTPPLLSNFENPPGSGSVAVGDYATQSFKIRSTGDTTLLISEIDMTCDGAQTDLDPFSFDGLPSELSDGDPDTTIDLVPGAELTLTVRFAPTEHGGTYNKCFIIESNGGNPQVNLSAFAIEPDIGIDPTVWDFGSVYVGEESFKTFTVQNNGLAVLNIGSIDSPATPFSISSDGCSGQSINPGDTCEITARFAPTSSGGFNSQFTIHSNDPDTPDLTVDLQGTGVDAPNINVTPVPLEFGDVAVGGSKQLTLTVLNNGTTDLTINSITDPSPPFSIASNNCTPTPYTLGVGNTCDIVVEFAPTSAGSSTSTIVITSDDPNDSPLTIELTGNGVLQPDIDVSPMAIDFGNVYVGYTAQQTITVSNIGTADLTIDSITDPTDPFSIVSTTCWPTPYTLGAGNTCEILVQFAPTSEGLFSSNIVITSDDPDEQTININLKGNGVPLPDIDVNPTTINFGDVYVGDSAQQTITVSNLGTANLTISSITDPSAPFSIVSNNCPLAPAPLGSGSSCEIVVQFAPTTGGLFASTIVITSDDPDEPTVTINLTGNGLIPPDIDVSPTAVDFGTVDVYSTSYKTLTIMNTGGEDLHITSVTNPGFPFGISADNCTGQSISSGSSCTVEIYFNPTYEGLFDPYYMYIYSNDPDEPSVEITLRGEAIKPQFTLTVNRTGAGTGTVTSDDGGINCGSDCSQGYESNATVILTATADPGSVFVQWGGDCSVCGTDASCTVIMDADKSCNAQFGLSDPVPDIKANDSDDHVVLHQGDSLIVTVSLAPGNKNGLNGDWWVLMNTPAGWYYYDHLTDTWRPGMNCTAQVPLMSIGPVTVMDTTAGPQARIPFGPDMPTGTYDFYFGVDMNPDCRVTMTQIYYDTVRVVIIP